MNSSFAILEQSSWIERQRLALFFFTMSWQLIPIVSLLSMIWYVFHFVGLLIILVTSVDKCVICTYKLFFIFDNWMFLLRTCFVFFSKHNNICWEEFRKRPNCVCLFGCLCERERYWYELIRELFCSLYIMYMLWSNKGVLPI